METQKILTGQDINFIKKTMIVREYNSEKDGYKGKKYRIYAFGDKSFTVHEDEDFHEDLKNGDVKDLMITVTEDGWSYANHVTWTKANSQKRKQVEHESISVENYTPVGKIGLSQLVAASAQ
jgi:hypothetical protein